MHSGAVMIKRDRKNIIVKFALLALVACAFSAPAYAARNFEESSPNLDDGGGGSIDGGGPAIVPIIPGDPAPSEPSTPPPPTSEPISTPAPPAGTGGAWAIDYSYPNNGAGNGYNCSATEPSGTGEMVSADGVMKPCSFWNINGKSCPTVGQYCWGSSMNSCHTAPGINQLVYPRMKCFPAAAPVNGACNNMSQNSCDSGSANDAAIPDADTEFRWRCDGLNGGLSSGTCSISKSICTPGP